MDALVKATIDSLKKILPQLQQELEKNYRTLSEITNSNLPGLLMESHELIDLLMQRTYTEESSESNANRSLLFVTENGAKEKDSANKNVNKASVSADLSDEEAIAMMQAMESGGESSSDDMDDDEARKLLADMDSPVASPDVAEAPALSSSDDMDDDEARRLLAEMDSSPANIEMGDDEAKRLLAEMESDAEPSPKQSAVPVPRPVEASPAAVSQHAHSEDHDEDGLVEINEWEPNEFQSDPTMLSDFITNSDELMQTLDASILQLEQDPTNKGIIEEIFRSAHTLKGASGMFGFKGLERVMHRLENLFDLIRKDKLIPNSDMIDTVFQGLDMLRTLLQAVKDGKPCGAQTVPVVHALSLAAKGQSAPKKAGAVAKAPGTTESLPTKTEKNDDASKDAKGKKEKKDSKEQSTIRVDLERLDVLVNLVGELVIDRSRFASIEEDLRNNHPEIKLGSNFSETVQLFGRHMNEIQDIIMKVRMVPIGNAFNKFTRLVRDLSRSLDKKIDLVISGEDAELDKTLVEQIGDPLIHLIRNSCDHGIEMPADRQAKGKDPQGRILLSAAQEGNNIVIKIEDDGKGMDPAYIRKKAVEKGLISEDTNLNDRDSLALIFEPGFSTADKVTNLSGRGVGMDVVKKQIMKLKGSIDLDSKAGRGTSTTIRLPLTLAIVQSLLVRSQGEVFAIPLNSVIESIRISPKDIQKVGEASVYKLRETVLPLIQLDEAMALGSKEGSIADLWKRNGPKPRQRTDRLFVVVVGHPDRPTGIIVDQLLNQQEMVIKPMGPLMKHIPCVAGGAVLGQGEVVLVLDVPELEAISRGRSRYQAA